MEDFEPIENLNIAGAQPDKVINKHEIHVSKKLLFVAVLLIITIFIVIMAFLITLLNPFNILNKSISNQTSNMTTITPTPSTQKWKTYDNFDLGFTLKYPYNFSIYEDYYNGNINKIFIENFNENEGSLPKNTSDDFQLAIQQDSEIKDLTAYQNRLPSIGASQISEIAIDGNKAVKYQIPIMGQDVIEIVTVHNGKAYKFTLFQPNSKFIYYLADILYSFEFYD